MATAKNLHMLQVPSTLPPKLLEVSQESVDPLGDSETGVVVTRQPDAWIAAAASPGVPGALFTKLPVMTHGRAFGAVGEATKDSDTDCGELGKT